MNKPVTDGEETSGEKEGEEVVEEPAAPEVRNWLICPKNFRHNPENVDLTSKISI